MRSFSSSSMSQLLISGATEESRRSWRKVGSPEADDNTRAKIVRYPSRLHVLLEKRGSA